MRYVLSILPGMLLLMSCGAQEPAAPAKKVDTHAAATTEESEESHEEGTVTRLEPFPVGEFRVNAEYIGEVSDGHFNVRVEGEGVQTVRAWIGDEAATDVVVTRAPWEEDHYCAHMEMPGTIAADARFWVDIEKADGSRAKGSSALTHN